MFGHTPSYGFYVRHVKNIEMTNMEVRTQLADMRPAIILKDVTGADCVHIKGANFAECSANQFGKRGRFQYLSEPADCGRSS